MTFADMQELKRLERETEKQYEAIKLLRDKLKLILPLAKGYAAANPAGSLSARRTNSDCIFAAERALDDTDYFVEEGE